MQLANKSLPANFYYLGNHANLKPETAKQLLQKALRNDLLNVEPTQLLACPDSMQTFVYICTSLNDDLFKADGYRWQNGSFKRLAKHEVTVQYNYIVQPAVEPTESNLASSHRSFENLSIL